MTSTSEKDTSARMISLGPACEKDEYREFFKGTIGVNTPEDQQTLQEMQEQDSEAFYERTLEGAPEGCIDGSRHISFADAVLRNRGPQSAGGTPIHAAIHYMVQEKNSTFLNDLRTYAPVFVESRVPFIPGGHNSVHAHGQNCGCGGIDAIAPITEVIGDEAAKAPLGSLVQRVLGERFDPQIYELERQKFARFHSMLPAYLEDNYQNSALDMLDNLNPGKKAVEPLAGDHGELEWLINHVPYTTFYKDVMANVPTRNGREMRAFGSDAWWYHELPKLTMPGEDKLQLEFATAMACYDAAAIMVLTNGSINLRARV